MINWVPIYCDIATKILVGASVSVPAAALCINRRLYHIVSVKSVRRTVSEVSSFKSCHRTEMRLIFVVVETKRGVR